LSIENPKCGLVKNFGEYESPEEICKNKKLATDTRITTFKTTTKMINENSSNRYKN